MLPWRLLWSLPLAAVCQVDWKEGTLANGLRYMLIHDDSMAMAKVSVRVAAGHSASPDETPALAYLVAKTFHCSNGQESDEPFHEVRGVDVLISSF